MKRGSFPLVDLNTDRVNTTVLYSAYTHGRSLCTLLSPSSVRPPRRAGPQADGGQLPPAPPQRSPRAGQRPSPKRYLYRHHTAARGLRRTLKIEVRSRLIEPRRAAAAAATQPAPRRAAAAVAFKAGPRAAAAQKRRSGRGLPDL